MHFTLSSYISIVHIYDHKHPSQMIQNPNVRMRGRQTMLHGCTKDGQGTRRFVEPSRKNDPNGALLQPTMTLRISDQKPENQGIERFYPLLPSRLRPLNSAPASLLSCRSCTLDFSRTALRRPGRGKTWPVAAVVLTVVTVVASL